VEQGLGCPEWRLDQSIGFRPTAATRTRILPGPACGSGTSCGSSTSGPPAARRGRYDRSDGRPNGRAHPQARLEPLARSRQRGGVRPGRSADTRRVADGNRCVLIYRGGST
jgi:hypothetical protein